MPLCGLIPPSCPPTLYRQLARIHFWVSAFKCRDLWTLSFQLPLRTPILSSLLGSRSRTLPAACLDRRRLSSQATRFPFPLSREPQVGLLLAGTLRCTPVPSATTVCFCVLHALRGTTSPLLPFFSVSQPFSPYSLLSLRRARATFAPSLNLNRQEFSLSIVYVYPSSEPCLDLRGWIPSTSMRTSHFLELLVLLSSAKSPSPLRKFFRLQ